MKIECTENEREQIINSLNKSLISVKCLIGGCSVTNCASCPHIKWQITEPPKKLMKLSELKSGMCIVLKSGSTYNVYADGEKVRFSHTSHNTNPKFVNLSLNEIISVYGFEQGKLETDGVVKLADGVEKDWWRAESGEEYWCITSAPGVAKFYETGDLIDNYRYDTHNYYPTRENAEAHLPGVLKAYK